MEVDPEDLILFSEIMPFAPWLVSPPVHTKANWTSNLRQCGLVGTPATGAK